MELVYCHRFKGLCPYVYNEAKHYGGGHVERQTNPHRIGKPKSKGELLSHKTVT